MANDKLHALLSVEGDAKSIAERIVQEAIHTFSSKPDHFKSVDEEYELKEEGGIQLPPVNRAMVTTVDDKLKHTTKALVRAMDITLQKEITNTTARADLVVDGVTIAVEVPATALLAFEGKLKNIREMYRKIPTLPPARNYELDPAAGDNIFRCPPEVRPKTEKRTEFQIAAPATKEHPAQVKEINADRIVGMWTKVERYGMWTPKRKADVLFRLDNLIDSVKRARMQANDTQAVKVHMAQRLFDYVHEGKLPQS